MINTVRHVKAHRDLDAIQELEGVENIFAVANAAADRYAKDALSLHPAPSPDFTRSLDLATTRAAQFMKLAAHVLPCFDNEVRWQRPHRFRAPRSRRQTSWHDWQHGALGLQCRLCFRLNDGPRADAQMDGCSGPPVFLKRLLQDSKGHQLVAIAGTAAREFGGSLESCRPASQEQILCIQCGGWSQGRGITFGRLCSPPTRKGLEVLAVFRQGHCPNPRVRAVIDRAVPINRLRLGTAPPTRDPPTVVRTSFSGAETAPSHEQRMAALVERICTKEQSAAAQTKGYCFVSRRLSAFLGFCF